MSCGVGHRCGWNPVLLWLWHRPVPIALIRPLAWESPYAAAAAQEMAKQTNKKRLYIYIYIYTHTYIYLKSRGSTMNNIHTYSGTYSPAITNHFISPFPLKNGNNLSYLTLRFFKVIILKNFLNQSGYAG